MSTRDHDRGQGKRPRDPEDADDPPRSAPQSRRGSKQGSTGSKGRERARPSHGEDAIANLAKLQSVANELYELCATSKAERDALIELPSTYGYKRSNEENERSEIGSLFQKIQSRFKRLEKEEITDDTANLRADATRDYYRAYFAFQSIFLDSIVHHFKSGFGTYQKATTAWKELRAYGNAIQRRITELHGTNDTEGRDILLDIRKTHLAKIEPFVNAIVDGEFLYHIKITIFIMNDLRNEQQENQ